MLRDWCLSISNVFFFNLTTKSRVFLIIKYLLNVCVLQKKNATKVTLLAGKYGDAPTPTIEPLNQTDFALYDEYENSTTATTVYAL